MEFDSIACQIDNNNPKTSTIFHLVDSLKQIYKAYMIQLKCN